MAKSQKSADKTQIEKFRDKARELECDEDEDRFKTTLGKVAKHKPVHSDEKNNDESS
jgi:hypothetical protein